MDVVTDLCVQKREGEPDVVGEHDWEPWGVRVRFQYGRQTTTYTYHCQQCGASVHTTDQIPRRLSA